MLIGSRGEIHLINNDNLEKALARLRFLIIGTGRCGTGYAACILTACSLPTGHESVFGPLGPGPVPYGMVGDSSWLAVPYLGSTPEIKIIHLVRDPIRVVRSLVGIKFFSDHQVHGAWQAFAIKHSHQLPADDDLASAIQWIVEWNERCEKLVDHEKQRVRVEDLTTADAVQQLVKLAGGAVSDDQARHAMKVVPNDYNARPSAELGWEHIPNKGWGKRLRNLATRYGYSHD